MAEDRAFAPRRIVVALDASPASLDALAAAARLAARLGAPLAGVFVEDEELLRLAELPFAALVRAASGALQPLDLAAMEAALRALAAEARAAVDGAAARSGIGASFRIVRGRVTAEVLAAAGEGDLLVLGAAGHARGPRASVGATARAAAASARGPVLLLARGARLGERAAVVDDGSPAAARAVAVARRLAGEDHPPAIVRAAGRPGATAAALARLAPAVAVLPASATDDLDRLLALGAAVLVVR
ncbi:universal stress protein [Anaeromyxobacter oryzae]|uniref:UspA domain-containing protein n=1 Tax=Anaeromyxobacter oryzae TaxID=2918170 RepID=A0ABN6MRG0_9BACT|nr:universal stress protein [Anaeromyxobacter oryzae]BDG02205.1 hypothetical protein AMOR_12010 [Anaeromyxobacter oryzae]